MSTLNPTTMAAAGDTHDTVTGKRIIKRIGSALARVLTSILILALGLPIVLLPLSTPVPA